MSNPREGDMNKLHRLARCLKQFPRFVIRYDHQALSSRLDVFCDSNYAGCLKTRKSTQGGVCKFGTHCFKNWSSTQGVIALSSGEAEFYGLVKAASVGLGCMAMYRDMGYDVQLRVHTDATAAKGIASRSGLGKTRHIAVHYLWVQEQVRNKDFELHKAHGKDNPADLLTKHLSSDVLNKYVKFLNCEFREGRAESTPSA